MSEILDLPQKIHGLAGHRGVFRADAYFFVLEALEAAGTELPDAGHVSGEDLLRAIRRLGRERYGVMAPDVFGAWGVRSTLDFGRVVFHMVDAGLLRKRPGDALSQFIDKFDFEDAFSLRVMRGQA